MSLSRPGVTIVVLEDQCLGEVPGLLVEEADLYDVVGVLELRYESKGDNELDQEVALH